jgi:predicted DNA-binding transcriptional regulator AlpA
MSLQSTELSSMRSGWIEPRGLRKPMAAHYVGVSPSTFETWIEKGMMPSGKKIGGVVLWDRRELDVAFDNLPDETQTDTSWENPEA